ncbi:MAG: hypothetical protein GXY36_19400 [Chloroflexi bacterium]|jgi:hypothetical protein|nr:hypothetical protein [Chloroflexota bacterium]
MAQSPSPELIRAFELIKAGQRMEAAHLLKAYLAGCPQDVDGWWLMAHAVTKPENVRRCLEQVLKIDPQHPKAREKLARLGPSAPAQIQPVQAPARAEPAAPPPAREPVRFASLAHQTPPPTVETVQVAEPYGTPLLTEAQMMHAEHQPGFDPAANYGDGSADPFGEHDPYPAASGPTDGPSKRNSLETVIGFTMIVVALVVLVLVLAYAARERGWIGGGKSASLPDMTTLEAASFSVEYPEAWDARCLREAGGYQVCGVANHAFYNQVEMYAGQPINFEQMFADLGAELLGMGLDLPDEQVSVVIMDVPQSSPAYDGASWAKTKAEWAQEGWFLSDEATIDYDRQEITVDGRTAYYYHYRSEDPAAQRQGYWGQEVVYDVYVPHDGLILWMTVSISTNLKDEAPDQVIERMIESISIHSGSE